MTRAIAVLLLLLAGCASTGASTGAYRVTYRGEGATYTAYALTSTRLLSLHHGPLKVGHLVDIPTLWGTVTGAVVVVEGDLALHEELRGCDSGAGVVGDCNMWLGAVCAKPLKQRNK